MDLILLENGSIRVILNADLPGEDRIFDVSNVFRSADRRINRDPRPRERDRERKKQREREREFSFRKKNCNYTESKRGKFETIG